VLAEQCGDKIKSTVGHGLQRWQQKCHNAKTDRPAVVGCPITNHEHLPWVEPQIVECDSEMSGCGFWTPCSKDKTNNSIKGSKPARSNAGRMSKWMSLMTPTRTSRRLISRNTAPTSAANGL
jgi:hypothetical protein